MIIVDHIFFFAVTDCSTVPLIYYLNVCGRLYPLTASEFTKFLQQQHCEESFLFVWQAYEILGLLHWFSAE